MIDLLANIPDDEVVLAVTAADARNILAIARGPAVGDIWILSIDGAVADRRLVSMDQPEQATVCPVAPREQGWLRRWFGAAPNDPGVGDSDKKERDMARTTETPTSDEDAVETEAVEYDFGDVDLDDDAFGDVGEAGADDAGFGEPDPDEVASAAKAPVSDEVTVTLTRAEAKHIAAIMGAYSVRDAWASGRDPALRLAAVSKVHAAIRNRNVW